MVTLAARVNREAAVGVVLISAADGRGGRRTVSDDWIAIVALVSVFGSISWVAWVITDALRQRSQLKVASEFHGKLLDRLSSARDFGDFLNSEGGVRFLNSLAGGGPKAPQTRIIRAVVLGIVLLTLGFALFLFVWFSPTLGDDTRRGIIFVATIAVALGVGLIVAAAVSYSMSRRMGLLVQDDRPRNTVTPSI